MSELETKLIELGYKRAYKNQYEIKYLKIINNIHYFAVYLNPNRKYFRDGKAENSMYLNYRHCRFDIISVQEFADLKNQLQQDLEVLKAYDISGQ